jgi:hypothetical protein
MPGKKETMARLQKYLPLARDEDKTEKQDQPTAAKGQWVNDREVTPENRSACELLCKFGNFRIID